MCTVAVAHGDKLPKEPKNTSSLSPSFFAFSSSHFLLSRSISAALSLLVLYALSIFVSFFLFGLDGATSFWPVEERLFFPCVGAGELCRLTLGDTTTTTFGETTFRN